MDMLFGPMSEISPEHLKIALAIFLSLAAGLLTINAIDRVRRQRKSGPQSSDWNTRGIEVTSLTLRLENAKDIFQSQGDVQLRTPLYVSRAHLSSLTDKIPTTLSVNLNGGVVVQLDSDNSFLVFDLSLLSSTTSSA